MYNISIIGAGQLGSRHLQALKSSSLQMRIFVVDNCEESLNVAKERYEIIPRNVTQEVMYCLSILMLPPILDLVIVATSSKPRASIIRQLLEFTEVKNLILEKVLFPKLSEYDEVLQLLRTKKVNCWVNCPRRMYGMYQDIKEKIDRSQPVTMLFQETNWGLCCNSIHMIDLLMFMSGESAYTIDVSSLNNEIIDSKRPGYIELYGTIAITTEHGSSLKLVCEKDDVTTRRTISNGDHLFEISETGGWWKDNGQVHYYKIPYQSQLTGLLADMILSIGYCPLSSFENSVKYHKPFVAAVLAHYNYILDIENDLCPIT